MEPKRNNDIYMRRRLLGWILKGILILFILILLFMVFLALPPGENIIKNQVQDKLSSFLGESVKIGSLETNIFSHVQLNQIEVGKDGDSPTVPLLKINQLNVSYTLWPILKKEIKINSLSISGMQANLFREPTGTYNLPAVFTNSQTESSSDSLSQGFKIILKKVNFDHSAIFFSDKIANLVVSLGGISLDANELHDGIYNFQIEIDSGGVDLDNNKFHSLGVMASGQLNPESLQLDSLQLNLPDGEMHGHLTLDLKNSSKMRGQFYLNTNIEKYTALVKNSIPAEFYPVRSDLVADIEVKGELNKPQISTTLKFSNGELGPEIPFTAKMQMAYSPSVLDVQSFDLKIFEGNISGNGNIQLDSLYNHRFTMKLTNLSLGSVRHLVLQNQAAFTGEINGGVKTEGPLKNPVDLTVNSTISLTRMFYNSKPMADLNGDLRFDNKIFAVNMRQGESRLKGSFELSNHSVNGNFLANIRQIQTFANLAGISDLKGHLEFSGTISGQTNNPDISLSFRGDSISYQNMPLDTINGGLDYRDNKLILHKTMFSGELTSIDSLKSPFHLMGLTGGIAYNGSVEGPVDDPKGQLNVSLNSVSYQKWQLAKAEINLSLDSGRVELNPSYFQQDSVSLLAEGEYTLKKACGMLGVALTGGNIPVSFAVPFDSTQRKEEIFPFGLVQSTFDLADSSNWRIDVKSYHLDLDKVIRISPLDIPISGNAGFDLSLRGKPPSPRGKFRFELKPFQYKETLVDSIHGAILLTRSDLQLDSMVAFIGGEQSGIKGRLEVMHRATGSIYLSPQSLVNLRAIGKHLSLELFEPFLPEQHKVNGFVNYTLNISGQLEKPKIRGTAEITGGSFLLNPQAPGFENVSLNMAFQDSLFIIKPLQGKYLKTPFQLNGQFITQDWKKFRTNFQLQLSDRETLDLSGRLYPDSLNIQLAVKSMDLSILQPFVPQLNALKGEVSANLSIRGMFQNPSLFGELKIDQLGFQPVNFTETVSDGRMNISLNRQTVRVDSFFFKLAGGTAQATGDFTLDHFELTEANLKTSLENMPIERPDFFKVLIDSAQLVYQKKNGYYQLSGDLALGKSQFTRNIEPQEIIQSLRTARGPITEPTELQKNTRLNIRLRQSKDLWIDNNLANIQFDAALEFIGTLANPNVTGRVQAEKGYVMYLDRKFQVDTAIVDFVDPNKLNPIVNLKATSNVTVYERQQSTDYQIVLMVTGPLDEPVVALTSTPPLSKSDILSVLTLGTTTGNLLSSSEGGSSVTNVLTRRVEAFSSQRITRYLSTQVGNLLGLDQVMIEGNIFRFNQGGGPQLVAKKTFLNRFEVTYSTTVGHINDQGIRLDYNFSKHWAIQGESNQKGETGIDLKYQIKFK